MSVTSTCKGPSAEVRGYVGDFDESVADFLQRADRTTLKASVFNVPKRTEVTLPVYTRLAGPLFRQIAAVVTPEELGRQLRKPALRPNALHLTGVFWQHLLERERRLALALEPLPWDEFEWTLEWVGRALVAYRGDGSAFPCERTGWHTRILPAEGLDRLVAGARRRSEDEAADLRRLSASLELYSFMLHGEHRDGIHDHGPYPLADGRFAMVKDFTDLSSEFLPWATPEVRLDPPAVSIVSVLGGMPPARVNWAGTAEYAGEPYEHLVGVSAYAVRGEEIEPLEPTAWRPLGAVAQKAQKALFISAVGWPDADKISYGSWLFANHLQTVPTFLAMDRKVVGELGSQFARLVEAEMEDIDPDELSPVWARLRRGRPFTEFEEG